MIGLQKYLDFTAIKSKYSYIYIYTHIVNIEGKSAQVSRELNIHFSPSNQGVLPLKWRENVLCEMLIINSLTDMSPDSNTVQLMMFSVAARGFGPASSAKLKMNSCSNFSEMGVFEYLT